MAEALSKDAGGVVQGPVDAVLLIDGDNDPHFPPDFPITPHTLVRVFLRPGAKMPRGLERRVGSLPFCVTVLSPKGGSNAADFIMSLHIGILHATLPLHLPFTLVTADKSLSVMAQELQRVGRQAILWTSHPERGRRRAAPSESAGPSRDGRRQRAPRRSGRGKAEPAQAAPTPEVQPQAQRPGRGLAEVAAAYAARLSRIKDPPSRLKTLLNDIANRTGNSGHSPEAILEELKRGHGLSVDERGKVHRPESRGGA